MGKDLEKTLEQYVDEYVACRACRGLETELIRGQGQSKVVGCKGCGACRSVKPMKSGFVQCIGRPRRSGN
jgi:translation initiation factor 2 subunit 2